MFIMYKNFYKTNFLQNFIVYQWRAGRAAGGQGAMAPPAKDFRGRKTCKRGRQMHGMKQER